MARTITGVDIGFTGVRALEIALRGDRIRVLSYRSVQGDGLAAQELPREIDLGGRSCVLGLRGKDLRLHYAQVPPVPDWQLRNLVDFEVQEIASQSRQELCSDFNLLPGSSALTGEDTVMICMARAKLADRQQELVEAAGGRLISICPNAVALYNAVLAAGEAREGETLLVAGLGHQTMDVILLNGVDLLFARNLSGGGKVIDDAISQAFNVKKARARLIKLQYVNVDPTARDRYASSQEEKVSRSVLGAAGQLASSIRSTVAFCQSQTGLRELKVDRMLLCGGTSRTRGLRKLLNENFRCPVDRLDPFQGDAVDLSALAGEERKELEEQGAGAVIALGLALGAAREDFYQIEILPERLKRRRQFLEGPLYALLAAVAAFLFLVYLGFSSAARQEELETAARRLRSRANALERVDSAAGKLLTENREMVARIGEIEDLGGRGTALCRTWQILERILPEDLWLTKIEVRKSRVSGRKEVDPVPQVILEGEGVPTGRQNLAAVLSRFLVDLERESGVKPVSQVMAGGRGRERFRFTISMDYFTPTPPEKEKKEG